MSLYAALADIPPSFPPFYAHGAQARAAARTSRLPQPEGEKLGSDHGDNTSMKPSKRTFNTKPLTY
jgi:hypothetical protein